jgi:protein-tyrosine phosphatase
MTEEKMDLQEHGVVMTVSQITENIYVGTSPCCKTDFEKKLLDKGVRADVSMENERLDQLGDVDYFLWLPTPDMTAPSQEKLLIGAQFIDSLMQKNIKVYVHCKNGHGRAPTMIAAYFVYTGMNPDDAVALIAEKRPEIHLNDEQKEALDMFHENL